MAEGGVVDLETQRTEVSALLKTPLRRGDTWYLIDSRWFKQWKKYVGFDSWDKYQMGDQNVYPGPIDNSGLLKDTDTQSLKEHLIDELDYILLPTEGWNKLVSWYTMMENQETIARKVVEQGMFVKHCKVEVYLTELKLCENGNMNNVVTRRFSKADTIDMIEKEMRTIFNIPDDKETRLWNKYMSNTFEPLTKPESTIQDAGLYQGQMLVIEQRTPDGQWPRGSSPKNFVWKSSTKRTSRSSKIAASSAESIRLKQDDLGALNDFLMSVNLKGDSNLPTVTETYEQIRLLFMYLDQGGANCSTSNIELPTTSRNHGGENGPASHLEPPTFGNRMGFYAVRLANITEQLTILSEQMLCSRETEAVHHAENMGMLKRIEDSLDVLKKQSLISLELKRRELIEMKTFQSKLLEIERQKLIIKCKNLGTELSSTAQQ